METKVKEIIFKCSHCKATLKAPGTSVGKEGMCPTCNHKVVVPEKSENTNPKNK